LTISEEAGRAFDNIQHNFKIKSLKILGIEGINLDIIMAIYDKPYPT
jgi:hypothetical protein